MFGPNVCVFGIFRGAWDREACSRRLFASADWLAGWLTGWFVGWLIGWLVGWLVCWLVGWLAGWLGGWLVGWLAGHLILLTKHAFIRAWPSLHDVSRFHVW